MNENFKTILITIYAVIALVLTGGLIYLLSNNSFNLNFITINENDVKEENLFYKKEIELNNINNINIAMVSSNVRFIYTNNDKIVVEQYTKNKEKAKKFIIENSSAKITIKEERKNIGIFNFNSYADFYYIYIPEQYKEDISLVNVSGDIYADLLKGDNISVKTTSGEIELRDIESNTINIKSVSGEIIFNDLIAMKTIEIESTSGEIEGSSINSKNNRLKSVSGNIEIDLIEGKTDIKTTSGEIEIKSLIGGTEINTVSGNIGIDYLNINSDSKLKTTSGEIEINLEEKSNINISSKSTSGDIDNNYRGYQEYESYNLDLKTVSGNIDINIKD